MLRKKIFHNVALFGSTSEIGLEVLKFINVDRTSILYLVGREEPDLELLKHKFAQVRFIKCNFLESARVEQVVTDVFLAEPPDIAILAAGILPPENNELNLPSVYEAVGFNSLAMIGLLSQITRHFIERKTGTIMVFSSVASQKPRSKNFTYGASKAGLDFYAIGLAHKVLKQGVAIKVLRLGYVFTRMSANFTPAPFAITKEAAAREIVKTLKKNSISIYIPKKLRFIFFLLRIMPRFIFSKLE